MVTPLHSKSELHTAVRSSNYNATGYWSLVSSRAPPIATLSKAEAGPTSRATPKVESWGEREHCQGKCSRGPPTLAPPGPSRQGFVSAVLRR